MNFRENYHRVVIKDGFCLFFKGEFSQWFPSPMTIENNRFVNCEQYMMYKKAVLFEDFDVAREILKTNSPMEHKTLGRAVKIFDQNIWEENRFGIVFKGNLAKFSQNKVLAQKLLDTENLQIVEASPFDRIWGIGFSAETAFQVDRNRWGLNLLGKSLMNVRRVLNDNKEFYERTGN